MYLNAFDNVCILCCCSITNTVISLVAHKLNSIQTTWRNSRLDQVSLNQTEQICKIYHRAPLEFPQIFPFLL